MIDSGILSSSSSSGGRFTSRKNEAKLIYKAAYRIAAHPGEFDLEPQMASRFFSSILAVKSSMAAAATDTTPTTR